MKNSDKVTHVGFTIGGNSPKGTLGAKVRFITNDTNYVLRTKELKKMGADEVFFIPLPNPMTKVEAVNYLASQTKNTSSTVQDAISYAMKRLSNPRITRK